MLLILTIAGTKKSVTAKFAVTGLILQTQIITPKKVTVTDKICFLFICERSGLLTSHFG